MSLYLMRRAVTFVLSLLFASLLIFGSLQALGGGAAAAILGLNATPEGIAALRAEMGLDQSIWIRYGEWLAGLVQGDIGESILSKLPVSTLIADSLQVTLPLAILAIIFAVLIALPTGVYVAMHHQDVSGLSVSAATQVGIAVPVFWAGIMLSTIFAARLGWFSAGGFNPISEGLFSTIYSLLLPALSLAVVHAAMLIRYVRSAVLEVMRSDYVRTARAKGMTRRRALWRHGLRNAAIPVVTVAGVQLSFLVGGTIVIEIVYFLPGVGSLLIDAIKGRDIILVQGVVVVITAFVLTINFIVDILYGVLDPRMRRA